MKLVSLHSPGKKAHFDTTPQNCYIEDQASRNRLIVKSQSEKSMELGKITERPKTAEALRGPKRLLRNRSHGRKDFATKTFDDNDYRGDYCGMSLNDVVQVYSAKHMPCKWLMKGFKVPKTKDKRALSTKNLYALRSSSGKGDENFMQQVVTRAKALPSSTKYSKVWKWTDTSKGKMTDTRKRVTYFDEVSRASKGTPGPATYKKEKWDKPKIKGVYLT